MNLKSRRLKLPYLEINNSYRCIALCIGFSAFFLTSCGNSHEYYNQAVAATSATEKVLINNNMCKDASDCSQKGFVFFEAGAGVFINVYAVKDKGVSDAIAMALCDLHNQNLSIEYRFTIYTTPHGSSAKTVLAQRSYGRNEKCQ